MGKIASFSFVVSKKNKFIPTDLESYVYELDFDLDYIKKNN